jgi:carbon monoxide dehydrogenase subunit G
MKINSKIVSVNKSPEALFEFLKDVKNFETLMPENISKFEVINPKAFVFALKGMPEIALEVKEALPHEKLVLGAMSDKIPFNLTGLITPEGEKSKLELQFEGDFNAMMAMMIKGPITKFLETLASNIEKLA